MKGRLTIICCVLVLLATGVQAQTPAATDPAQWKRYAVPELEFSVTFPTLPAMSTSQVYYPLADKPRRETLLGVYAEGLVYQVDVYENTERYSLTDFARAEAAAYGFTAAKERQLNTNGIAGQEYSMQNAPFPEASQLFVTKTRLYRFDVTGAAADDPRVKHFFASIVLGNKQDGIVVSDGPGTPFYNDIDEPAFAGKDVDKRLRVVMKPQPSYTDRARKEQVTGTVVLKVIFTSAGNISNIRTVSGLPFGLTENAIEAAKNIKFLPAVKGGKNVATAIQLEYNFNLY